MTVDGEVTAEAEGLFVTINAELAAEYFGRSHRRSRAAGSPADDSEPASSGSAM